MGYGITIPFDHLSLAEHQGALRELVALGYEEVWTAEANGTDAFTPLALAAAWEPSLRLGCAIVPAFTRGPALMAQHVAAMAEAAPGRFSFGIGSSSNVIVSQWNGIPFEDPYARVRDMTRFLKLALTGEKVDFVGCGFSATGLKLGRPPKVQPDILIAALREGMLRLAGKESDGAIVNWLSAENVKQVAPIVQAGGPNKQIVARIFVCPSTDTATVRNKARFAIAAYLNVPVYAAFHEWLGNGPRLAGMWEAWKAGDRKAALAAIPDDLVDELIIHGSPDACREQIRAYVNNGVTTVALALLNFGIDPAQAIRDLAPSR